MKAKLKIMNVKMIWLLFTSVLVLIMMQESYGETFLEKQKRIAEEHWKSEQERQSNNQNNNNNNNNNNNKKKSQEISAEGDSSGSGSDYYYYYDADENQNQQTTENDDEYVYDESLPTPKKNGYQKSSVTYNRKPEVFSLPLLINEFKEKLNCLTHKEIESEMDRVEGKGQFLKKPLITSSSLTGKAKPKQFEKDKETEKDNSDDTLQRRSFQQIQEEKRRAREEEELLLNQIELESGFLMGSPCENRICSACEVNVEEFAYAVHSGIFDPKYQYIYDITEDFCERKEIKGKYIPLVGKLCLQLLEEESGKRNSFVSPFESESKWDDILTKEKLFPKTKQICASAGLCSNKSTELDYQLGELEDHEKNDRCIVCRAFARDVEARVSLQIKVTEGGAVQLIQQTCQHLTLTPEQQGICETMITGKLADDIGWITKIHSESILRKKTTKVTFPTKLCQEIGYCPKQEVKKVVEEEIDAPYW